MKLVILQARAQRLRLRKQDVKLRDQWEAGENICVRARGWVQELEGRV